MKTRRLLIGLLTTAALSALTFAAGAQGLYFPYANMPIAPFTYSYLLSQGALASYRPLNPIYLSSPSYQLGSNDAFGFLTPSYPGSVYDAGFSPYDIPRTSDSIEARLEDDNMLWVAWQGASRAVIRIQVDILDKDRKSIAQKTIMQLPTETRIRLEKQAAYYRVLVQYINGTVTVVTSPLGERKTEEKKAEPETGKTAPTPEKEKPASDTTKKTEAVTPRK